MVQARGSARTRCPNSHERQRHNHCSKQPPTNFPDLATKEYNKTQEKHYHATTKVAIMAPSKANQPEYSKDEKVLCFHLELLYEAKVLDVKPKDPNDKGDGYVYKIHYKGWKNT